MVEMARKNERAHLAPAPDAVAAVPEPFPESVIRSLLLSALVGALLGVLFATLLLRGTVAVPGWDPLYSMSQGTFFAFWVGIGTALGVLVGGVGAILIATPSPAAGDEAPTGDVRSAGGTGRNREQPRRRRR